jgi:hypothetical protein
MFEIDGVVASGICIALCYVLSSVYCEPLKVHLLVAIVAACVFADGIIELLFGEQIICNNVVLKDDCTMNQTSTVL